MVSRVSVYLLNWNKINKPIYTKAQIVLFFFFQYFVILASSSFDGKLDVVGAYHSSVSESGIETAHNDMFVSLRMVKIISQVSVHWDQDNLSPESL